MDANNSWPGVIFTIALYICLGLSCGWMLTIYFEWDNPPSLTSDSHGKEGQMFEHRIYSTGFAAMFLFESGNRFIKSEELYRFARLEGQIVVSSRQRTASCVEYDCPRTIDTRTVNVFPCRNNDWYKLHAKELFTSNEQTLLDSFAICFDGAEDLLVFGRQKEDISHEVKLNIYPANLSDPSTINLATTNLNIRPLLVDNDYLKSNISNPLISLINYKKPISLFPGLYKKYSVEIGTVSVLTTGRVLGEQLDFRWGGFVDTDSLEVEFGTSSDSMILQMVFIASNRIISHHRNFIELFSLLSNLGGVTEMIYFLLFLLFYPINSYILTRRLVTESILKMSRNEKHVDSITPEDYNYKLKYGKVLIFNRLLCNKASVEHQRVLKYLMDCQEISKERTDIFRLLHDFQELLMLKRAFFTKAHRKLAPIVGLTMLPKFDKVSYNFSREGIKRSDGNHAKPISNAEALTLIKLGEGGNEVQRLFSSLIEKIMDEISQEERSSELQIILNSSKKPLKFSGRVRPDTLQSHRLRRHLRKRLSSGQVSSPTVAKIAPVELIITPCTIPTARRNENKIHLQKSPNISSFLEVDSTDFKFKQNVNSNPNISSNPLVGKSVNLQPS